MKHQLISSGSKVEQHASYSRALRSGDRVLLSGSTGYDYASMSIHPGAKEQCLQLFRNAEEVLAEARTSLKDVVMTRIYCTSPADFEVEIGNHRRESRIGFRDGCEVNRG